MFYEEIGALVKIAHTKKTTVNTLFLSWRKQSFFRGKKSEEKNLRNFKKALDFRLCYGMMRTEN